MIVFVDTHDAASMTAHVEEIRSLVERLEGHALADHPATADAILFLEPPNNKFRRWAGVLREDPVVMNNLDRCFVRDGSDRPVPFLPGLYWSMSKSRLDPERVVAADAWYELTEAQYEHVTATAASEPPYLFSFRGFRSHPVRAALMRFDTEATPVTITTRFWDFAQDEAFRLDYLTELRNSRFVLCPRGLGPSTQRVYEAMELGRVPVVISDEWVPPPGPEWDAFSIRIGEAELEKLPATLRALDTRAEEMGKNARGAWEAYAKPGTAPLANWLDGIRVLIERRAPTWSAAEISRSWSSQRFQWRYGIHPAQGAAARVNSRIAADRRPRPGSAH